MRSEEKYKQTEKRVRRMKNFYNHLQVFVIVMFVVFLFSDTIISFFEKHIHNGGTLKWVEANIWINALLWLIGLVIHGLYAFKFKTGFIDKWEEKKVKEIMKENK